jgi:hypothetical protein
MSVPNSLPFISDDLKERKRLLHHTGGYKEKNGIEILGLIPELGSFGNRTIRIHTNILKMKLEMNGVKPKGSKTALVRLLMKI